MMGPNLLNRRYRIEWHQSIDRGSVYHLDLSDQERPRCPWVLELGAEGSTLSVYYPDLTALADSMLGILELCTGELGDDWRHALRRQIICRLAAEALQEGAPPDLLTDPADQVLLSECQALALGDEAADPAIDHAESEPAVPAPRRLDWPGGEPSEGGSWGGPIDELVD